MPSPPLLFDLGARGAIVLTGRDRAAFLHGLVTNDVNRLRPGAGCAAAFLTPKGKMLADCVVLCEEERLEIDCAPELAGKVEDLLRKYLVFNDVTIANGTAAHSVFHLTGEKAGDAAEALLGKVTGPGNGFSLPREPHAHAKAIFPFKENTASPDAQQPPGDEAATPFIRIVCENRTGDPGWDLRLPSSLSKEVTFSLLSQGARLESAERFDALRIAAGIPRWGFELTEAVLPDEAGLRARGFISESKGCYVGQETVARIKTYGHVNRRLVLLSVAGGVPAPGDAVFFEGESTGALTSVAFAAGGAAALASAPVSTPVSALAFVRRERSEPGTLVSVASAAGPLRATVSPAPTG